MDFSRGRREDYPEINLIPFIDILLVIVIFLAVTTTYARFAELKINLPTSSAAQTPTQPKQIEVAVAESGRGYDSARAGAARAGSRRGARSRTRRIRRSLEFMQKLYFLPGKSLKYPIVLGVSNENVQMASS